MRYALQNERFSWCSNFTLDILFQDDNEQMDIKSIKVDALKSDM